MAARKKKDDGGSLIAVVVALRALPRLERLGVLAFLVAKELNVGTCSISEALYAEATKRREARDRRVSKRRPLVQVSESEGGKSG